MDYYTNVAPQIRGQKTQTAATNLLQNDITPDMLSDAQVSEMGVSRVELENEYASQQKANEAIRVAEERAAAAEGRLVSQEGRSEASFQTPEELREIGLQNALSISGIDPTGMTVEEMLERQSKIPREERKAILRNELIEVGIDP